MRTIAILLAMIASAAAKEKMYEMSVKKNVEGLPETGKMIVKEDINYLPWRSIEVMGLADLPTGSYYGYVHSEQITGNNCSSAGDMPRFKYGNTNRYGFRLAIMIFVTISNGQKDVAAALGGDAVFEQGHSNTVTGSSIVFHDRDIIAPWSSVGGGYHDSSVACGYL